jgi:hypothetical protein
MLKACSTFSSEKVKSPTSLLLASSDRVHASVQWQGHRETSKRLTVFGHQSSAPFIEP